MGPRTWRRRALFPNAKFRPQGCEPARADSGADREVSAFSGGAACASLLKECETPRPGESTFPIELKCLRQVFSSLPRPVLIYRQIGGCGSKLLTFPRSRTLPDLLSKA